MKRILQLSSIVAFVAAVLLSGGCEQQKPENIQWQLPLQAPEDPHGPQSNVAIPAWAADNRGDAELVWLHKSTTHLKTTTLAVGGSAEIADWHIRLLGLASGLRIKNKAFIDDRNMHNPAALVELSRGGEVVYRGWLYQEFPELFGLDDPEWKVWLKGINIRGAKDR
ncbi:MAG: DUF2155 domain-containing protein [Mariprofundus sp.]